MRPVRADSHMFTDCPLVQVYVRRANTFRGSLDRRRGKIEIPIVDGGVKIARVQCFEWLLF